MSDCFTIKEASEWATNYLNKDVTTSNISYLIQYAKVKKINKNGYTYINKKELKSYYDNLGNKKKDWKNKLGEDLNWILSFDNIKESERTKHVHRLHPYKGKFIPQLVEYFLDAHTDEFKNKLFFKKDEIILDPFCGSGTTLIQANELGIHAIGVDISPFNVLISNIKVSKINFIDLHKEIQRITNALQLFICKNNNIDFENDLLEQLAKFNNKYFPSPEYKYKLQNKEIDEKTYSKEKSDEFLQIYFNLLKKYNITLKQEESKSFIDKWYLQPIRSEIDFLFKIINQTENKETKNVLCVILSRTIRSCRATTHSDLATLKEPVTTTYYCKKHGKICKPLFSILSWWKRYSIDTIKRLEIFNKLKTNTYQICLTGDSRAIDIHEELKKKKPELAKIVNNNKIKGIFSSPPYVGLINYHEQHAYSYDLLKLERKDELEIGPLSKGKGKKARELYIQGISDVLNNCKRFLVKDYDIFLVANDKFDLYPTIAEKSGMKIINKFKRPVLNRTEKDNGIYSEGIFHLKKMGSVYINS